MIAQAPSRPRYVLALLACMYFFYMLDRNAVLVTQEMIKTEFALSDTEIGLVTGLFYGGAYALVGLPLGRAIDFVNRRRLLALLIAVWSGTTLLCGFASRFGQLAVARILVGASESGGSPTALSLLSDLFPSTRRAAVSSIFFAGSGVGGIVSFMAGGFIAAHYGWRAVFLIYGVPGLVLAALILFTIQEPKRQVAIDRVARLGFLRTSARLLSNPPLIAVYVAAVTWTMSLSGIGNWMLPYLMRVHHLQIGTAGVTVALAFGVLSTLGSIGFGFLADHREQRRIGGMIGLLGAAALVSAASAFGIALASTIVAAISFYAVWGLTALVYSGTVNAAIARLAPEQSRGLAFAFFAVLCNLIGAGLGPVISGAISDHYQATMGGASIRPAIGIMGGLQLVSAAILFSAVPLWRRGIESRGEQSVGQAA